jgi:SAM-dependent methyltransferase
MNPPCPVCRHDRTRLFQDIGQRCYWRCRQCQATFLDPLQRPDASTEKSEYDRHQNDPADPGYRRFLERLATPLLERLAPGSSGLDYGCGPGPALAAMLTEAGHLMTVFDPIYFPDCQALERQYDFISCTEVVEHFHDPAAEFERLDGLLRPGGWLGIMTRFQTDDARFAGWHYRRDPTHVVFYRAETMQWLIDRFGWDGEIFEPGIVLAKKMARRSEPWMDLVVRSIR